MQGGMRGGDTRRSAHKCAGRRGVGVTHEERGEWVGGVGEGLGVAPLATASRRCAVALR